MNLVIITSIFKVYMSTTIYNEEERKNQIKESIESIKNKIPNAYIVLLEGGTASDEDIQVFSKLVNEFLIIDIKYLPKNIGEFTLIYKYLHSENFLNNKNMFKTISKLSGRYSLNDAFNFNESFCFKHRTFEGKGIMETRYYRFPIDYFNNLIKKLNNILNDEEFIHDAIDIEHMFSKHEILPIQYATIDSKIGISGYLAPCGILIQD